MAYSHTSLTERQIYEQLWLKAYAEGQVTLTLSDKAAATRTRFALYNAVRGVKSGQAHNPRLLEAAGEVSVSARGNVVTLTSRRANPDLAAAAAALGLSVESLPGGFATPPDAVPAYDPEIAQSLVRLQGKLQEKLETPDENQPVRPKNPYYTR